MKQKDWTDQLRDRLADHQAPVNDDLWTDIETSLDLAAPTPRPLLRRLRWPAVAAAAVALLLGSSTLLLWDGSEQEPEFISRNDEGLFSRNEERGARSEDRILSRNEERGARSEDRILSRNEERGTRNEDRILSSSEEGLFSRNEDRILSSSGTLDQRTLATEGAQEEGKNENYSDLVPRSSLLLPRSSFLPPPSSLLPPRETRGLLAATFYTENGFADWQQSERVLMNREMADRFAASEYANGSRAQSPVWLADFEERQHHDRPLTLGLRVSYSLNSRLSLSSGLVYTRLHSEFTTVMRGEGVERQQTLHYVGLPLSVQYRLLRYRRFSLYASAGTEVDWNVSAQLSTQGTTTDGERDRCQWSFCGSMGLAYDLTPALSVYAEPGIHHYPDNHSTVQNYFKDRPTAFSLQMGLRLQLGKKE